MPSRSPPRLRVPDARLWMSAGPAKALRRSLGLRRSLNAACSAFQGLLEAESGVFLMVPQGLAVIV